MPNITKEQNAIILGALLHDIGKFYLRAGVKLSPQFSYKVIKKIRHGHARWSGQFISDISKVNNSLFSDPDTLIELVLYHADPGKKKENLGIRIISIADKLSSAERREEDEYIEREDGDTLQSHKVPLVSVFNEVSLGKNKYETLNAYDLQPLRLDRRVVFPFKKYPDEELDEFRYSNQKDLFETDIINLFRKDDIITLCYLLYKHSWSVPSATPHKTEKRFPDVSLFDHSRTTTAIASCLASNYKLYENKFAEKLDGAISHTYRIKKDLNEKPLSNGEREILSEKLFCLLSADMFGIQDFIYATLSIPGVSKRLRGRSLYLGLMNDVIARYIVNELGLSTTNILYCGGGRFDILLPNDEGATEPIVEKVDKLTSNINKWLFDEFYGEVGLTFEKIKFSCKEFKEWDEILKRMDDILAKAKKRKQYEQITTQMNNFFSPEDVHMKRIKKKKPQVRLDVCESCNKVTIDASVEEKKCELCEKHQRIGEILPKTISMILCSGPGDISISDEFDKEVIEYANFGKVYLIYTKKRNTVSRRPEIKVNGTLSNIEYLLLNETEKFINAAQFENSEVSFGFKFLEKVAPTKNGKVLEFEEIAEKSEGDKKLGVLKMDIDHLGLILQIGFSAKPESDRTISRIATMSRMFDLFFSGYINKICDKFNKIYIIYSGGDDLLLLGPWSEMPHLSQKINEEFKEYVCKNPDITLSSGLFFCKPKFPVKRFAPLVGEELDRAKDEGRNRVNIFGEIVKWSGSYDRAIPFIELLKFGEELYKGIMERKIPTGFLHQLLRLHSQYFVNGSPRKILYIPILLYQITRNIRDEYWNKELRCKLITTLESIKWMDKIRVPVTYALLKSRR